MKNKQVIIGVTCALVSNVLFGFSYLFTKNITHSVSTMTLLSWRFMAAFVVLSLCALAGIVRLDFRGKPILTLALLAFLQPVIYFIAETVGISLTTASESGVIIASVPIVTLLFSALLLKEPPTKPQVIGISLSAAGILTIVLMKGLEASFNPAGYATLLLAVVSGSLYSILAQKTVQFSAVEKTYAMMGFGAVVFTGIALVEHARAGTLAEFARLPLTSADFLVAVLYLGIGCSLLGFLLVNTTIAAIGANRAVSFVGIVTLVAVIAGIVILKEQFTAIQSLGAVLVLGGVYLANLTPARPKAAVAPATVMRKVD